MVRRLVVLAVALSSTVVFVVPSVDADPRMVRVDLYRPANDGLMNSIGCIITIVGDAGGGFCHDVVRGQANRQMSGGTTTVLLGGDHVVCELKPGVSLQAFTPRALRSDAYTPDARSWVATTLAPHAHAGQTVEVGVVPKSRGSAYLGGWLLRQEPHAATQKRASRH